MSATEAICEAEVLRSLLKHLQLPIKYDSNFAEADRNLNVKVISSEVLNSFRSSKQGFRPSRHFTSNKSIFFLCIFMLLDVPG